MTIDAWLLDILRCPMSHARLRVDAAAERVCIGADCRLAHPMCEGDAQQSRVSS